eukprot:scaffold80240_cov28-Tisochrysis_lutea.AAC.2
MAKRTCCPRAVPPRRSDHHQWSEARAARCRRRAHRSARAQCIAESHADLRAEVLESAPVPDAPGLARRRALSKRPHAASGARQAMALPARLARRAPEPPAPPWRAGEAARPPRWDWAALQ